MISTDNSVESNNVMITREAIIGPKKNQESSTYVITNGGIKRKRSPRSNLQYPKFCDYAQTNIPHCGYQNLKKRKLFNKRDSSGNPNEEKNQCWTSSLHDFGQGVNPDGYNNLISNEQNMVQSWAVPPACRKSVLGTADLGTKYSCHLMPKLKSSEKNTLFYQRAIPQLPSMKTWQQVQCSSNAHYSIQNMHPYVNYIMAPYNNFNANYNTLAECTLPHIPNPNWTIMTNCGHPSFWSGPPIYNYQRMPQRETNLNDKEEYRDQSAPTRANLGSMQHQWISQANSSFSKWLYAQPQRNYVRLPMKYSENEEKSADEKLSSQHNANVTPAGYLLPQAQQNISYSKPHPDEQSPVHHTNHRQIKRKMATNHIDLDSTSPQLEDLRIAEENLPPPVRMNAKDSSNISALPTSFPSFPKSKYITQHSVINMPKMSHTGAPNLSSCVSKTYPPSSQTENNLHIMPSTETIPSNIVFRKSNQHVSELTSRKNSLPISENTETLEPRVNSEKLKCSNTLANSEMSSKPNEKSKLKDCENTKKSGALSALRHWKCVLEYQILRTKGFILDNHEKQRLLERMLLQKAPKKRISKKGVDKIRRQRMMAERWLVDSQYSPPKMKFDLVRSNQRIPSNFHHEEKLGSVERKLIVGTTLRVTRNEKLWKVLKHIEKEGYENVDLGASRKKFQNCAGHPLHGFKRDEDEVQRRDGDPLLPGFTNKLAWEKVSWEVFRKREKNQMSYMTSFPARSPSECRVVANEATLWKMLPESKRVRNENDVKQTSATMLPGLWTVQEDKLLAKKTKELGDHGHWEEIAGAFGDNRHPICCLSRWQRKINKSKKHVWTKVEDMWLKRLLPLCGENDWTRVARHFNDVTANQCHLRWRNTLRPNIRHAQHWTKIEDLMVNLCVRIFGRVWVQVSKFTVGRTDLSCRERFVNFLDPTINTKAQFSDIEIQKLRELVSKYGEGKWSKIARELNTGRTDWFVSRMWHDIQKNGVEIMRIKRKNQEAINKARDTSRRFIARSLNSKLSLPKMCKRSSIGQKLKLPKAGESTPSTIGKKSVVSVCADPLPNISISQPIQIYNPQAPTFPQLPLLPNGSSWRRAYKEYIDKFGRKRMIWEAVVVPTEPAVPALPPRLRKQTLSPQITHHPNRVNQHSSSNGAMQQSQYLHQLAQQVDQPEDERFIPLSRVTPRYQDIRVKHPRSQIETPMTELKDYHSMQYLLSLQTLKDKKQNTRLGGKLLTSTFTTGQNTHEDGSYQLLRKPMATDD